MFVDRNKIIEQNLFIRKIVEYFAASKHEIYNADLRKSDEIYFSIKSAKQPCQFKYNPDGGFMFTYFDTTVSFSIFYIKDIESFNYHSEIDEKIDLAISFSSKVRGSFSQIEKVVLKKYPGYVVYGNYTLIIEENSVFIRNFFIRNPDTSRSIILSLTYDFDKEEFILLTE